MLQSQLGCILFNLIVLCQFWFMLQYFDWECTALWLISLDPYIKN